MGLDVDGVDAAIVELRIHGVSGTPPEQMLETHHVRQVAGDALSRFFIAVDGFGDIPSDPLQPRTAESRTDDHARATRMEGFHWGRYTSGNWRQALWLALIPFGMVNAAQFMLSTPTDRWPRVWHTLVGVSLRLLAFGLTSTFALATASISIDLIARQRLADTELGRAVGEGTLLAAGAMVAGAVVYLLYRLGRRDTELAPPEDAEQILGTQLGEGSGLTQPDFYSGDPDATSLGRLHLAGGLATVALVGALTDGGSRVGTSSNLVLWASATLLVLLATLVSVLGDPEGSAPRSWENDQLLAKWRATVQHPRVGVGGVVVAAVVFVVSLLLLWTRGVNQGNPLAAVDSVSNTLVVVLTANLLVLSAASAALAYTTRGNDQVSPHPFQRYASGMAAPVVASAGGFLAVGYTAASLLATAQLFVRDAELPALVRAVTVAWGLTVLLAAGLIAAAVIRTRRGRKRRIEGVRRGYGRVYGLPPDGVARPPSWMTYEWMRHVASATAVARVKLNVPIALISFTVVGTLLALWIVMDLLFRGGSTFRDSTSPWIDVLSQLGAWTLVGLAGLMMSTARQSLRVHEKQRVINTVWDVVSFWPRSVHPFVPPPYSQFAVQSLRDRIRYHLGTDKEIGEPRATAVADGVVVEAHSQGSFIAVAALLWLTPAELERVCLLTFGSQLQVMFPRAFPAYMSYPVMAALDDALDSRWINLFRETDPIAGPVLSWDRSGEDEDAAPTSRRLRPRPVETAHTEDGSDAAFPLELDHLPEDGTGRRECGRDWRLLDPSPPDARLEAQCLTPMLKHSHFPLAADWDDAVERLVGWLCTARVRARIDGDVAAAEPAEALREVDDLGPLDHEAHD